MSFKNKVVLVTGASSGIGAAIALKFAEEGANIAIVGRNKTKLQNVFDNCKKTGSEPLVINADVTNEDDAKRIINDTVEHFKKLDVLINNAGIARSVDILDENSMQTFDEVINVNLRSCVNLTRLAGEHLFKTKGNIINISSIYALCVTDPKGFAYCASKAALDHFTRVMAYGWSSKGVRVNTINPGPVKSDIYVNMGQSEKFIAARYKHITNGTALKRMSEPEEIADLAVFIASDKAVAITGSSFVTDNGVLVKARL